MEDVDAMLVEKVWILRATHPRFVSKVTALEVDVANCFLDLSLVVWSMDAEQMLTYHRQIWEMMDHRKALDNTHFRVPTEGAMWDGRCLDRRRLNRGAERRSFGSSRTKIPFTNPSSLPLVVRFRQENSGTLTASSRLPRAPCAHVQMSSAHRSWQRLSGPKMPRSSPCDARRGQQRVVAGVEFFFFAYT